MLVSGELENVPLLEVLQVVAYSKQTGLLSVDSAAGGGVVLFQGGGIVGATSLSTGALLSRAATESDPRTRQSLRRVQTLAALSELLALRSGMFTFKSLRGPLEEVAGVSMCAFYEAGPMNAGELLLAIATIVDKKDAPAPARSGPKPAAREKERSHARFAPIVVPATVSLEGAELDGHLTNLSEGGTFFHGDVLPTADSPCRVRFTLPNEETPTELEARVAWARSEGDVTRRGAGLSFQNVHPAVREKLRSYLERYQKLAEEVRKTEAQTVKS